MAQHPWLDPSPFFLEGGPVGLLLIHGFTGSPPEMRLLAGLATRGITISVPLLAGHGTTPEDLARCRWQDWVASAETALTDLQHHCEVVFVGGLSMGALLALHLGACHPEIRGLIPMAPALWVPHKLFYLTPVAKYFIRFYPKDEDHPDTSDPEAPKRLWSYSIFPVRAAHELLKLQRLVRRELPRIHQPILIFQGRLDRSVDQRGAQVLYERVSARDKELVWLENSGHCLTVDSEWQTVAEKIYQFMVRRVNHADLRVPVSDV